MPSVSRAGGVTQYASVTYPPPGTVNKGAGVSNGGTGGGNTFDVLMETGDNLLMETGDHILKENAP